MTNKRFWLGILIMVLVFGMMFVGCDNGNTTTEPETLSYSGVLYGKNWHNSLPISESSDMRYNEKQWIDINTVAGDDTGFLLNKSEYAVLQGSGEYYGVKVDNNWIKISRGFEDDGHTEAPENFLVFGSNWEMIKWETSYSTYGDFANHKVESKTFEDVDASHIKIGGQTYKYEVSVSNTRNLYFSYFNEYALKTWSETGTFKMHILKIWLDGDASTPTIFLAHEERTTGGFIE